MPTPVNSRRLRDEVMFDLAAQLDELHALVADVSTIARMVSHVQRRAAALNRLRSQSIANMREAQNLDDAAAIRWDGIERRRDHLAAVA